jgi:hypothetical protein
MSCPLSKFILMTLDIWNQLQKNRFSVQLCKQENEEIIIDMGKCIFLKSVLHYRGAGKSLARLTSRCSLFDGKNISFDASLGVCVCVCVCIYIYIYIVLIVLQL